MHAAKDQISMLSTDVLRSGSGDSRLLDDGAEKVPAQGSKAFVSNINARNAVRQHQTQHKKLCTVDSKALNEVGPRVYLSLSPKCSYMLDIDD